MDGQLATKVLLVDDEKEFVDLLSQRLEARGLMVVAANDGEHALEKADDKNIDVAVIDLAMPGIDGIETLTQLKDKRPDIEVIMLTGQASVHSGIDAMKHGAVDFLEKPVEIDVLLEAIHQAKMKRTRTLDRIEAMKMDKLLKSKYW